MSLLGGGVPGRPWYQGPGAFGILALRYDRIPAWFAQDTLSEDNMAPALDSLIEESSEESSSSEEAASCIHRAALRRVRQARRHHQQGAEKTVRAAQQTQRIQDLVKDVTWWVPNADRQLERFAACLEREVVVDCPVDNATMDEWEKWLGLSF